MGVSRLLCLRGRHTGQKDGGTSFYKCPRCGKDWLLQPNDLRWVAAEADRMILSGRVDEGVEWAREQVRRYA